MKMMSSEMDAETDKWQESGSALEENNDIVKRYYFAYSTQNILKKIIYKLKNNLGRKICLPWLLQCISLQKGKVN